jgi:hypothetical protein
MAKKDDYCSVNDQGAAPTMTNTGLKALAKTGSLYKNDKQSPENLAKGEDLGAPVQANNQPPEHR